MTTFEVTLSGRTVITVEVEADDTDAAIEQALSEAAGEMLAGQELEWEAENVRDCSE